MERQAVYQNLLNVVNKYLDEEVQAENDTQYTALVKKIAEFFHLERPRDLALAGILVEINLKKSIF